MEPSLIHHGSIMDSSQSDGPILDPSWITRGPMDTSCIHHAVHKFVVLFARCRYPGVLPSNIFIFLESIVRNFEIFSVLYVRCFCSRFSHPLISIECIYLFFISDIRFIKAPHKMHHDCVLYVCLIYVSVEILYLPLVFFKTRMKGCESIGLECATLGPILPSL